MAGSRLWRGSGNVSMLAMKSAASSCDRRSGGLPVAMASSVVWDMVLERSDQNGSGDTILLDGRCRTACNESGSPGHGPGSKARAPTTIVPRTAYTIVHRVLFAQLLAGLSGLLHVLTVTVVTHGDASLLRRDNQNAQWILVFGRIQFRIDGPDWGRTAACLSPLRPLARSLQAALPIRSR